MYLYSSCLECSLLYLYFSFFPVLDFNFTIGCAWAHIGALRIHLLLSCNEIDPTMKFYSKYSQLMETISTLELEIQVFDEDL